MSEARDLTAHRGTGEVVQADAGSLMAVISRAASDPNTDVDKLERLMGLYERITAQQAKGAFNAALARVQPQLPVIEEHGATDKAKYATWEDINDGIRPVLHEHGFALSFRVRRVENAISVTGILSHEDGHSEETTLELPSDTSGSKNAVQAVGSSLSYGKRYTAMALLNITSRAPQDRDDDGKAAGRGRMSKPAQDAIAEINACEGWPALENWRDKKSAAHQPKVSNAEWQQIIELWNRRVDNLPENRK